MIGSFRSGRCCAELPPRESPFSRWGTCFFLFIIVALRVLSAQEKLLPVFHFNRLSTQNGLPLNEVRSNVVRDRDGYVWVGTANGLARFDGYGCRNYRHVPDDPYSLSSNAVTSLMVDGKGRLWVGTFETGISLYDAGRDRFVNFLPHGGDSTGYEGTWISTIMEDRAGGVWFTALPGELVRAEMPGQEEYEDLDSLARKLRFTSYALGTLATYCSGLFERADGVIVVGSDRGLVIFNPRTRTLSRPRFQDSAGRQLDSMVVQCLFSDTHGDMWAGTATNGIYYLNWKTMRVRNYAHREGDGISIRSNDISGIVEDPAGHLWIASARGLDRFSPESGESEPYLPFGPDPRSSTSSKLSIDRSGTIWISKFSDGVYWLSPKTFRFPHYSIPTHNGSPKSFESIERDLQGNLWMSAYGSIYQIDIATLRVLKTIDVFKGEKPVYALPDRNISFLDARGHFWYGTWGLGLYRVNLATNQVRNYRYPRKFGSDCVTRSVAPGEGDSLWVACEYDGLMNFDSRSGKFLRMPIAYASNLTKDRSGKIWVSSDLGGLHVHDPSTGRIERFAQDPSNPRSLSNGRTRLTYEDPSGRIWVGVGTVIDLWDPATRSFTHYPNSAFPNSVYALPVGSDSKGRLWVMYTPGDLSIFDPSSGIFTNLNRSDGICVSVVDMENLQDGRIVLAGWGGINVVDLDSINPESTPPPLVITRMAINDESVVPSQLLKQSSSIRLSYLENTLEFEFAAIDIDVPQHIGYSYQLEGLDKDWVAPKDRRVVRYASLPPGDYVFHVKAVSSYGSWSDQEQVLAFSIAPPWWRSAWAYASYALFFATILFGGFRLRLRQVHLKQQAAMEHFQAERLAEVDKLKSRFFANISHEFRTPLTLILGPVEQVLEATGEPSTRHKLRIVEDNARKLHGLVSQLLDFSRIESGTMKLQVSRNDIVRFLRRTVMSFESWAEKKNISLDFHCEGDLAESFFDSEKLEKIVNNLMSNALKFTPVGGIITVDVAARNHPSAGLIASAAPGKTEVGTVEISVVDTGPGISADHLPRIFERFYRVDETHTTEGTGIGLALTKELVELHHGTITVESAPGKGSVFTVRLPIAESAYAPNEITESAYETETEHVEGRASSEKPSPVPSSAPGDGKPIVVVVEDNVDLRAYIREYLEADYAVLEASDGKAGLHRATETVPDLVITDVMMPEMDGMELCRALKQDVRTSHVPVILLTARAGTDSKIEGLEVGADDYMTKPFETKVLGARVRNLIEQRRQLRKKFSAGIVLKPGEVAVTSLDDALLKHVMETVERNIGNEDFSVEDLARAVSLSKRHLERKLRALTNLAPIEFIRHMRLQRAYELLEKNAGSVAEIAFQVGFGSPAYFTTCFHERFGFPPSEIRRRKS